MQLFSSLRCPPFFFHDRKLMLRGWMLNSDRRSLNPRCIPHRYLLIHDSVHGKFPGTVEVRLITFFRFSEERDPERRRYTSSWHNKQSSLHAETMRYSTSQLHRRPKTCRCFEFAKVFARVKLVIKVCNFFSYDKHAGGRRQREKSERVCLFLPQIIQIV